MRAHVHFQAYGDCEPRSVVTAKAVVASVIICLLIVVSGCHKENAASTTAATESLRSKSEELAAISTASRFASAADDAKYIGSAACVKCHVEENASYQATHHFHALTEVDLSSEPPPEPFDHTLSGRHYTVTQDTKTQQLIHGEQLIGDEHKPLTQKHPIRYVIGSGNHSRSYLLEIDGFLIESPITWYQTRKQYAMSPGYDRAAHHGFERMADVGCIYCHAGQVTGLRGNRFQPVLQERTIGCENCHGPGDRHLQKHAGKSLAAIGQEDRSIVNPRRLSRDAAEAICANCHLRGAATVQLPGKDLNSFRPGQPLTSTRIDYILDRPEESMKVVGHVEQMHMSACYKESDTMTCTTCHDPHSTVPKEQRIAEQRRICVTCHEFGCELPAQARLKNVPDDNCVTCHMPQSATDIPHIAFTHHRIGQHTPSSAASEPASSVSVERDQPGDLIPIYDVSDLPQPILQRSLGLAYFEYSETQTSDTLMAAYRKRAEALLDETYRSPLRDAEVEVVLARLAWESGDIPLTVQLAESALRASQVNTGARSNALFLIGESRMQQGDLRAARKAFEQLVQERRVAQDWVLLTLCHTRSGQLTEAIKCLQQALRINPYRRDLHEMIIEVYRRTGNVSQVQVHEELLKALPTLAKVKS